MQTKSIIGLFSAFLVVMALLLWGHAYYVNETYQSTKPDLKELSLTREQHVKDSIDLTTYRSYYSRMQDSFMSYAVENGRLSIELNRKEKELNEATTRYTKFRQEQQVERALNLCDSIVYNYVPEYLHLDDTLKSFSDLTAIKATGWVELQNEIIEQKALQADSALKKHEETLQENIKLKAEKQKLKITKKHERKRLVSWGVIGAAIGALTAVIFGG